MVAGKLKDGTNLCCRMNDKGTHIRIHELINYIDGSTCQYKNGKSEKKRNKHKSEVPRVVSELILEFSGSSVPVFCSCPIFRCNSIVVVSNSFR